MVRKLGPKKERADLACEKLITATIDLVIERGLSEFSLSEVGVKAGFRRALPGYHFKSREELVAAAMRRVFEPPEVVPEFGLSALLEYVGTCLLKASQGDRQTVALALLSSGPLPASLSKIREAYRRALVDRLAEQLRRGQILQQVRDNLVPWDIAPILLAQVHGEMRRLSDEGGSPELFVDLLRRQLTVTETPKKRGAGKSAPPPAEDDLFRDR